MRPLLFDVCRCHPITVDAYCRNCKRWDKHPEQTFGPRTPIVDVVDSTDPACNYIPISQQKP